MLDRIYRINLIFPPSAESEHRAWRKEQSKKRKLVRQDLQDFFNRRHTLTDADNPLGDIAQRMMSCPSGKKPMG